MNSLTNPKKSHRKKIIWGIVLIALGSTAFVYKDTIFPTEKVIARTMRSVKIEAEPVRLASISREITASGALRANQSVTIKALVHGQVAKIHVEGGQEVKKGEPIISIDDRRYRNKVKELESKLSFLNRDFDRYSKLNDSNYGKKKLFEKASADRSEAEAALDQARKDVEDCTIAAPFDGSISLNEVSVGMSVSENVELFTISDIDPIKIDFRIPSKYIKNISVNQPVSISIDEFLDQKFDAFIDAIDSKVDTTSHTIAIRVSIKNANNALIPGLFARVHLLVGAKDNAMVVPTSAVQINGDQESVYKLTYYEKENIFVAVRQPVTLGLQEKDKVEVIRGVKENDLIVTVGHMKIRDGIPVTFEGDKEYLDKYKEEAQNKKEQQ